MRGGRKADALTTSRHSRQGRGSLSARCRRLESEGESPPEPKRRGRRHEGLALRADRPNGIPKVQTLGDREPGRASGLERLETGTGGLPPETGTADRTASAGREAGGTGRASAPGNRTGETGPRPGGCRPGPSGLARKELETRPQGFGQAGAVGNRKGFGPEGPAGSATASARHCRADAPAASASGALVREEGASAPADLERRTERGFGIVTGAGRIGRLRPDGPRRNGGFGRRDADRTCGGFGSGAVGRRDRRFGSGPASKGGTARCFGIETARRNRTERASARRDGGKRKELAPEADRTGMRTSFGSDAYKTRG
jgi:hypothetical protein